MKRLLTICVAGWIMGAAGNSWATQALMDRLPTSSPFRCLTCHQSQDPPPTSAGLNPFGLAFKTNGLRWDHSLAEMNSDGDNCTNGFELADPDGDGRPDANATTERSNPGFSDCTLQLTPTAWSALKSLFR